MKVISEAKDVTVETFTSLSINDCEYDAASCGIGN